MRKLDKDIMRENSGRAKKAGMRGQVLDQDVNWANRMDQYDNRDIVNVKKVNGSTKVNGLS